ncbi:MAG: hypothetical protein A2091_01675 [Desulfuromonadales bacterium GWD2_61_12]|nr:MAG: hypothetical protein A2005_07440 [Desulfuromonadales bacterium GWC2_61_20]OGR33091.1 MAG: hypothetical protein A2091_01675 [Desulfuromonadales bacterium GWD2_61_12]
MKKLFPLLLVFLFCSGFSLGEKWFEKYSITQAELTSLAGIPKILTVFAGTVDNDKVNACYNIAVHKTEANQYFADVARFALDNVGNTNVFYAALSSAVTIFKDNDRDLLEKLIYAGATHPNEEVRRKVYNSSYNSTISRLNVASDRLLQSLENSARNEPSAGARKQALLALNTMKAKSKATSASTPKPAPKYTSKAKTDSGLKPEKNQHAVAVIIGNMNYMSAKKSVPNVDYALNDAQAIKEILVNVKGYREGNIIYLEDATQAEMVSTLGNKDNHKGRLFNWVRPESDVFIYYSGHGAPSLTDGSGYLLPVDADPTTVELNGYPLDTLYRNIAKLPARSITVVIDACFSGSSQGGTITKNASSIALKPITLPKVQNGINVLAATDVGEIASWDTEAQHSLFTSYFLKALSGEADQKPYGNEDRQISLAEVQEFLSLEVTYMARRQYGRDQNPQISGNSAFVFSTLKE